MKKKLLSLVLAGAMVASTSVSAFADTIINQSDNTTPTAEVEITGKVLSEGGAEAPGVFNVTIPTTAAFTVDGSANVTSATIKITNGGSQGIDVYAEKFVDTTPNNDEQITVVEESQLGSKNRTNVSLSITGRLRSLHLKSEDTTDGLKNGLYTNEALTSKATGDQLKLVSIAAGQEGSLTLDGKAGKLNDDQPEAVNNKFTLTLKIKKSAN